MNTSESYRRIHTGSNVNNDYIPARILLTTHLSLLGYYINYCRGTLIGHGSDSKSFLTRLFLRRYIRLFLLSKIVRNIF